MKTIKTLALAILLSTTLLSSCKKDEPVAPTLTEYCDIKCYYTSAKKWVETKNNLFSGTAQQIEDEKTKIIATLTSTGYKSIDIHNCTSKKH